MLGIPHISEIQDAHNLARQPEPNLKQRVHPVVDPHRDQLQQNALRHSPGQISQAVKN